MFRKIITVQNNTESPALVQKRTFKNRTRMFLMAVPTSTLLLCGPRAAFECSCRSSPAGWSHFSFFSCLFKLTTFCHKVNRDNLVQKPRLPQGIRSFPFFWAFYLRLWIWQKEFWVFFHMSHMSQWRPGLSPLSIQLGIPSCCLAPAIIPCSENDSWWLPAACGTSSSLE